MMNNKFSPIEFRREIRLSKMLRRSESGELAEVEVPLEFRFDPLTGHSCRIVQFTLERIIRPDLEELEKRSRVLACPFCPPMVEQITPKFPPEIVPEGNIVIGKSFTFPNNGPYDVYGAVVVISGEHFIGLDEFDSKTVCDALLAAQTHIRRVEKADSAAKYHFIAWNYMPPSGGSLVHPHLQSNAGYFPTTYQKQILEASRKYREEKGTNYWSDLLEQEKQAGDRYIGKAGGVEWLTGFMPRGRLSDVIAMFPGKASITELTEDDLHEFSEGLIKVFEYLNELNLPAFNMATYSGFDSNSFWTHVRITPRAFLLYSPIETSDQFYYQIMHDENICILPPEVACEKLKRRFHPQGG